MEASKLRREFGADALLVPDLAAGGGAFNDMDDAPLEQATKARRVGTVLGLKNDSNNNNNNDDDDDNSRVESVDNDRTAAAAAAAAAATAAGLSASERLKAEVEASGAGAGNSTKSAKARLLAGDDHEANVALRGAHSGAAAAAAAVAVDADDAYLPPDLPPPPPRPRVLQMAAEWARIAVVATPALAAAVGKVSSVASADDPLCAWRDDFNGTCVRACALVQQA